MIIDEGTMANQRYLLRHIPKFIPHNVNNDRNVPGAKYRIGDKVYVDNYWKTHIMDVWKDSDGVIWYQIAYPASRYSTENNGFKIVKEDYIEGKINESKKHYNMNKKLIRLTESDLHRIVKESVKKVIKEEDDFEFEGIIKSLAYSKKMAYELCQALKRGDMEEGTRLAASVYSSLQTDIKDLHNLYVGNKSSMQPQVQP